MKKKLVEKNRSRALLELRDVGKYFGGLKAVDHVSISVNEGDLHCLIGPNGAGKSTIFKMVMGIYKPTMGSIFLKDKNITHLKSWDRVRQGVSIKMQIPGVFGELTVYENMKIAAQRFYRHAELKNKIDEICDLLAIADLQDETVNNLSHGQQQWLEMGMSLASNPELLLLDEPAAGMGPEETNFTAELIRKLNKKGITILFIDHDMDFVKKIARKVTVLHFGKTFAEGSVEEIEANQDVVDIYLGKS
ncbi:ABC transporter ATP-binding protein [Terrilactibacillus laevilacticus]|uniref:ABC transporter ATP-binding protein n=1 Tax=Terrilactibacillus laevilacticus TaxID=1380157 RepID=UPI0011466E03|nr:ABC transporter ATP-binding protein [Terrilactibacillus laevilacticus]